MSPANKRALPPLPPLAALRAFEVAARLGSMSAAAEELSVTHGAVSQQVRALEDWLGQPLFERRGRRLILSASGEQLAEVAHESLRHIGEAVAVLRRRKNPRRLTVTTFPSFAARWLSPRIGRFLEHEPDIELNIVSTESQLDLIRDGIDVAIRFGPGGYPEACCEYLMDDALLVVCSPDYRGGALPRTPADLKDAELLHGTGEDWPIWFKAAGQDRPEPRGGISYNDSSLALQAAIDGGGVLLTRLRLAQDALRAHRLIQLFDVRCPVPWRYWLLTPPGQSASPLIARFREWLLSEVAAEQQGRGPARPDGL
ncbi:transcriptional regulator GcvA [Niveibacterium terrae]|uniref:transcriptional regulator GcvA n=1 Tax=Niveibacterium terrae TaxID=3373598 RepID=UPI003A92F5E3